jgi:polyhydroxyalkanoate synthase
LFAYSRGFGPNSRYPQDVTRLRSQYFSSDDQLVTLGLNGGLDRSTWELARQTGVPIVDLGKVDRPSFIVATREDHIVPWRSAYRSLGLLGGEKTFVLGAAGHVAGVINPAAKGKRSYWTGAPYPDEADAWLGQAQEKPGSWWPQWAAWLAPQGGGARKAPKKAGNARYRAIEPAPGRYVKQKAA